MRCEICQQKISEAHLHLDYVGHSDVTRTLTMIDDQWSWEPTGWTEDGQPVITVRGARVLVLWGRLTLLGVTRLCVGSCEVDKQDADKELVGDLIRNGAMRHNVYGSLWSKAEGLTYTETDQEAAGEGKPQRPTLVPTPAESDPAPSGTPSTLDDRRAIRALVGDLSEGQQLDLRSWCVDRDIAISLAGQVPQSTTIEQLTDIRDYVLTMFDAEPAATEEVSV